LSTLFLIKLRVKRSMRMSRGQIQVPAAAVIPVLRGKEDIDVVERFVAE